MNYVSIKQVRKMLDSKEISAIDLTKSFLKKISEKNPTLNAYLEVFEESAIEDAKLADEMIKNGTQSMLTGIPIAVKDNIVINGKIASAGSKMLGNYVAPYSATVIEKLKTAGVVILGRTNMDEFALGSSTENSAYGPTKNPHDKSRVSGGTSGGSACAVASGMALCALGSDTGGSVRQPASLCGVVGYKPTYGMVSRYGLIAAASSLDQIGTMAGNSEDAEILFNAIRGEDSKDSTSVPDGLYKNAKKEIRKIAVPRAFTQKGVDKDVLEIFEKSLANLAKNGYEIIDIEMPNLNYSLAAYYIINPAEVSSNLARLDGLRYGFHKEAKLWSESVEESRREGFGAETKRRILLGTFVLSSGYYDAYYRKAVALRSLIRKDFENVFESADAIAMPTSPIPAFKIGEKSLDPLAMYAADIFTVPINIAGVPAMSLNGGFVERENSKLPVGVQFISSNGSDDSLFKFGSRFENLE